MKFKRVNSPVALSMSVGIITLIIGGIAGYLLTFQYFPRIVSFPEPTITNQKLPKQPQEQEPNDTFATATPIQFGFETDGSLASLNDIDNFKFRINDASRIRIELNNVPHEYEMKVFDSNYNVIASTYRIGFDESSAVFTAPVAGTYYIQFKQAGKTFFQSPYSITVSVLEILN